MTRRWRKGRESKPRVDPTSHQLPGLTEEKEMMSLLLASLYFGISCFGRSACILINTVHLRNLKTCISSQSAKNDADSLFDLLLASHTTSTR